MKKILYSMLFVVSLSISLLHASDAKNTPVATTTTTKEQAATTEKKNTEEQDVREALSGRSRELVAAIISQMTAKKITSTQAIEAAKAHDASIKELAELPANATAEQKKAAEDKVSTTGKLLCTLGGFENPDKDKEAALLKCGLTDQAINFACKYGVYIAGTAVVGLIAYYLYHTSQEEA